MFQTKAVRKQCRQIAIRLTSSAQLIRSPFSDRDTYTVLGGNTFVLFRTEPLDYQEKAMRIYGSKYVPPMTCRQTEPFYVYSMTMPDNYGDIIHCEENVLAAKTMMSELALFSSKSEFPQREMDIELDAI